jgi:hypothetical protein
MTIDEAMAVAKRAHELPIPVNYARALETLAEEVARLRQIGGFLGLLVLQSHHSHDASEILANAGYVVQPGEGCPAVLVKQAADAAGGET